MRAIGYRKPSPGPRRWKVEQWQKVQERTKVAADERLAGVKEKVTGTWNKLEKVFEDRVERALHALNVPTQETHGHGRAHRAKAAE